MDALRVHEHSNVISHLSAVDRVRDWSFAQRLPLSFRILCIKSRHEGDPSPQLLGIKSVCKAYEVHCEHGEWTRSKVPKGGCERIE